MLPLLAQGWGHSMSIFAYVNLVNPNVVPHTVTNKTTLQHGFSIFYEIIGALAVLMLVIAALRYAINGSDPAKTAEAKKQIVYTLVGLVVITTAAVLVQFILVIK